MLCIEFFDWGINNLVFLCPNLVAVDSSQSYLFCRIFWRSRRDFKGFLFHLNCDVFVVGWFGYAFCCISIFLDGFWGERERSLSLKRIRKTSCIIIRSVRWWVLFYLWSGCRSGFGWGFFRKSDEISKWILMRNKLKMN